MLGRFSRPEISAALDLPDTESARIEETLVGLHLLRPMPGDPDVLAPVSPDAAAADLVGPTEQQLRALERSVSDARAGLLALLPMYFESRRSRNQMEAFDVISDPEIVQSRLNDCGARCREEVMTAQPGGSRPGYKVERARHSTAEWLERDIKVKYLYQHAVRSDLVTASFIRTATSSGAEVRTTDQLIDRMLIYDREIVFLPEQHVKDRRPGAIVVREPTLVAFLCKVYDHLWTQATPFTPEAEESSDIADDIKRAIIKLMAQGHKDELVARRLGMSVRTCRRHISRIMEELNSTSRFQAGVSAVQSGMLDESVGRFEQPGGTAG